LEKSSGQSLERARFDSPKQEMSQGDLKRLDSERVDRSVNPSDIPFSKGDLIQLYLAYLVDSTFSELTRAGVTDLPLQRFARPCWPADRAKLADTAFQKMLAKGQIIADTLHDTWDSGIHIRTARSMLDSAQGLTSLPAHVTPGGILEATAAASSALKGLPTESLFLVVDIGAGTCDFGLFFVRGGRRIAELTGTTQVLRQAGDRIDGFLVRALLDKVHVDPGSDEGRRMSLNLADDRRRLKEALFLNHHVSRTLENDATAEISISEFLNRPEIAEFVKTFTAQLTKCLAAPKHGTYSRTSGNVDVILTGGGSELPFIQSVFDQPFILDGHGTIMFRRRAATPSWLAETPDLQRYFPQLAVAVGGAQEALPEQRTEISDITPPQSGPRIMTPTYRS
jgi:molecular chaperone HscA